ncbi:SLAM family member 5-like isoform X2 [Megalobrama amblycephala]|uniref:SLAM family member 5-like isoform X2 n=1 Tax=Megalobrama amblycephala TaxID=75352 RepID=UPI0020147867|nr:SLAM family member 5-like isoform X2 [Megalobrama amblycephala]
MIHSASFFGLFFMLLNGVFGVEADEVKSVSVMEGDSVTLNTDVTEVQRDDQIVWMFGPQDARIAEIYNQNIKLFNIESFRDRLQMENQTGSLTIRNIRSEHTGLYKLQIFISNIRRTTYPRFNVTVYAPLPVPVITRDSSDCSSSSSSSNCSLVCTVMDLSHVTLSWYKGNSLLSSISVSDLSISLSLPLEVEYQDKNTYSCVLNNPIRNQTQHLDITQLCQTHTCAGQHSSFMMAVAFIALLVVIAVIAGLIYRRNCKQPGNKDLKITESEYTQIIYCLQMRDLPQKSLLDVGRTETAVNYQHIQ